MEAVHTPGEEVVHTHPGEAPEGPLEPEDPEGDVEPKRTINEKFKLLSTCIVNTWRNFFINSFY